MTKILSNKSNIDLDYPICRPSLDLDFTQEVLDPRITFSRGSIGTRVNRNRLIEIVSANQPRFDFDPVTGECKGLLIEESRTNNFPSNNAISFYSTNSISTGDKNPDGTAATLWVPNSSGNYHGLIPSTTNIDITSLAVGATIDVTTSCFTKNFNTSNLGILLGFAAYDGVTYRYLLSAVYPHTGVFPTVVPQPGWSVNTTQVIPYPNGWYRCILSARYTKVAGYNTILWVAEQIHSRSGQQFWYGDNGSGIYIWGIQREQGAFPTSYIPTTASTVTRSADNADMTGTNFSSWYNSSEGTLYASLNNITTRTSITFDRLVALVGTDVHRNVISICTQTASGGGAQNKFNAGVSYSPDGSYVVDTFTGVVSGGGPDRIGKAIITYKKDNFAFTVNGITPLRDIGGDIPVCNRLLIFGSARFQPAPSGHISRLTYYPRALKPNQLQFLTQ